jgi:thiopurine S-methyltransferase
MHEEFWRERWERQDIAFHQPEVNPRLRECWDRLGLARGDPVLVPLCGKSGDMWWLRTQGHPVLGVELSPRAAAAFYAEHGLAPKRRREGLFEVFEADGVRILCGNVFDLTADEVAGVRGVYDRAALVALPPALRDRYAAQLTAVVPRAAPMLLLTLEYPQGQMDGPPFSIPAEEVERLYGNRGHVRLLTRRSILSAEPGFAERGVTALDECAFLVTLEAS